MFGGYYRGYRNRYPESDTRMALTDVQARTAKPYKLSDGGWLILLLMRGANLEEWFRRVFHGSFLTRTLCKGPKLGMESLRRTAL